MAVIGPAPTDRAPGARAAGSRHRAATAGDRHRPPLPVARAGGGLLVLAILGLIAYTTTKNAWPWFREEGFGIFADNWDPAKGQFGAGAMIYGTFLVGSSRW